MAMDDRNEINTSEIIQYLEFRNPGLRVAIPRINTKTCSLENYIYTKSMEMALHKFGMAEPFAGEKIEATDIDLVITPLLAFDKKGYRVGFGKGFYDKLLAQCKPDVIKVGLSFFEAEEKIDDIHHNDIPLDYCITPETIYEF